MARRKYEDWEVAEFENTVVELACNVETMDEDEYEEKILCQNV